MPGNADADARSAGPALFRERLAVPLRWWVIATVGVAIGGAEVFAGFDWHVVVVVYAALALPVAAILLATGHLTVTVDTTGLHARTDMLPADRIGDVHILDQAGTRRFLGPGADRTAYLAARGYVPASVLIRTHDVPDCAYWLVSSRRPDDLVAALAVVRGEATASSEGGVSS